MTSGAFGPRDIPHFYVRRTVELFTLKSCVIRSYRYSAPKFLFGAQHAVRATITRGDMNRRHFLQASAAVAALAALPRSAQAFAQSAPLQKWMTALRGLGGA